MNLIDVILSARDPVLFERYLVMLEQPKQPENTTLVRVNQPGDMIIQPGDQSAFAAIFGNMIGRELHNFDGDERRQWGLKSLCASAAAIPLEETNGDPIEIVYYYGMLYEHEDIKTGEIEDRLRFVLVDKDNRALKTASPYVAREIGRAVATFGNKKFDPPLKMRLVKGKGTEGRTFFTLEPVL